MKMKLVASLAGVGFCGKPCNARPHTRWPDTHTQLWSLDCKFSSCFWLFCSSNHWWDQALIVYKTGFLRLCLALRDSILHVTFDSTLSADTEAGWPWWTHKQYCLSVSKCDMRRLIKLLILKVKWVLNYKYASINWDHLSSWACSNLTKETSWSSQQTHQTKGRMKRTISDCYGDGPHQLVI